jgi:alanyl-tRNA synthetase
MVLGVEKRGKESRVTFLCGHRAIVQARRNAAVLRVLGSKLSAGRDDLEAAIERIRTEGAEIRKSLKAAERRLAAIDAAELVASGQKLIVKVFEGKDLDYLRAVATEIASRPGMVVVLGGSGPTSSILLARAKEIELDLRPIGKEALAKVNGRGGGPPNLVQGGGDGADIKGALEIAERMILAAIKA